MKMMDPGSPFFLSINYAHKSGKAWYKRTPMRINKLYSIMNDIKAGASLQTSDDDELEFNDASTLLGH